MGGFCATASCNIYILIHLFVCLFFTLLMRNDRNPSSLSSCVVMAFHPGRKHANLLFNLLAASPSTSRFFIFLHVSNLFRFFWCPFCLLSMSALDVCVVSLLLLCFSIILPNRRIHLSNVRYCFLPHFLEASSQISGQNNIKHRS